jgi:hypothetical protein
MDDPDFDFIDFETRLKRYRPAGPPAGLRARVLGSPASQASWFWIWMPAALSSAAALVLVLLSANAHRDVMAQLAPESAVDAAVNLVTAELGGGDTTRALVARLIELDQQSADAEQGVATEESPRHE